jgi:hypothetical protein
VSPLEIVATVVGTLIVVAVLVDVFVTVMHLDTNGFLAFRLQNLVWRLLNGLASRSGRRRRSLLALAGPVMMVASFVLWFAGFVLGFTLVVWPHIGGFRTEEEIGVLGFAEALYYVGVTGTVLGYGDLTPVDERLRTLAWIISGLGFALLTLIVTYLLNVVSGVATRNALAVLAYDLTGGSGSGIDAVLRHAHAGELEQLGQRFQTLQTRAAEVHERMRQFPILDLYYRSRDATVDPEMLISVLLDMAAAGQLLRAARGQPSLYVASQDLGATVTRTMKLVARSYLRPETVAALETPVPQHADRQLLTAIGARLAHAGLRLPGDYAEDPGVLALVCQGRVFLDAIDGLTGWKRDHPPARPFSDR